MFCRKKSHFKRVILKNSWKFCTARYEIVVLLQNERPSVFFYRKDIPKNWTEFEEKYLCQSLCFNKVAEGLQDSRTQFIYSIVFSWNLRNFSEQLFRSWFILLESNFWLFPFNAFQDNNSFLYPLIFFSNPFQYHCTLKVCYAKYIFKLFFLCLSLFS